MHELADPVHDLHLVRLQVTDEVPAEGVAVGGVLALEILSAVLADDLDSGLDENGHLLDGHVLRGDDDGDAVADLVADASIAVGDLGSATRRSRAPTRRDELARGLELRLPPVELAVELPPAELCEHLADARGLREAECRELGASDLDPDVAEPREVVAELGDVLAREGQERSIRREGIGERDDLGRLERARLGVGRGCAARR